MLTCAEQQTFVLVFTSQAYGMRINGNKRRFKATFKAKVVLISQTLPDTGILFGSCSTNAQLCAAKVWILTHIQSLGFPNISRDPEKENTQALINVT